MEPGTPESPFARGGPGVRLASLAAAEQLREREAMNLKMEVAHLRERLHQRVGGDTTAIELEDENFTLRRALQDAQQALVAQREAADARHAKALLNLVRLDGAWKAGAVELSRAQAQAQELQARADDLARRSDSDARELQQLREEVAALKQAANDVRELQQLREEADALRAERQAVDARAQALERDYAAATAKLAHAIQSAEQHRSDADQLRDELARAQSESRERDTRLAQAEADAARLTQQVTEQQQQIAHIPQVHRGEYERLLRDKERAWEQREAALEQQACDAQLDAAQAHSQARELKQLQREVLQLLAGDSSSSDVAARAEVTGEEVRTRVKREVHRAKLAALEADKAKVRLEGLERQLAKQARVAQENSELRAENDRLKRKLAAARADRLDVNRTPVKASSRGLEKAKLKIESLEREVETLAALAKEGESLRAENERLRRDVEAARREAADANSASASLALGSEEAKRTIEGLEQAVAKQLQVAHECDELRRENARLRTDVGAARSESAEANRTAASASVGFHQAQLRIESLERELAQQTMITQENDELRAERARLKTELATARAEASKASTSTMQSTSPAFTQATATQSVGSAAREPPSWRAMLALKDVDFGAESGKVAATEVARSGRAEASKTPAADPAASSKASPAKASAWKRSIVKKIGSEAGAEQGKAEGVGSADASKTPANLSVSSEARQMIERIQRGSARLETPGARIDAGRGAESDKAKVLATTTATCAEKPEASKTPAGAGSAGKQSLEERLAQLRARAEPLRAKRKLEASEEQQLSGGVRRIFGLNRAHSAVRALSGRPASAAASAPEAAAATSAPASETHSSSEESSKAKFRRVFVPSRYLNHVTGRRADP